VLSRDGSSATSLILVSFIAALAIGCGGDGDAGAPSSFTISDGEGAEEVGGPADLDRLLPFAARFPRSLPDGVALGVAIVTDRRGRVPSDAGDLSVELELIYLTESGEGAFRLQEQLGSREVVGADFEPVEVNGRPGMAGVVGPAGREAAVLSWNGCELSYLILAEIEFEDDLIAIAGSIADDCG
jgi:hypothetical protein